MRLRRDYTPRIPITNFFLQRVKFRICDFLINLRICGLIAVFVKVMMSLFIMIR